MIRKQGWCSALVLALTFAAGVATAQEPAWKADHDAGWAAFKGGRFAEAEKYLRAAEKKARAFGAEDPRLATTLDHLAWVLCSEGKSEEGEALAKAALTIREKTKTDLLDSLNTVACLYDLDGKPAEAKPFYLSYLALVEKTLGKEHADAAAALDNLATVHHVLGEKAEAEAAYKKALAIREKVGEAKIAELAPTLHNLGNFYVENGKLAEAEPLLNRALEIRRKSLGADHPDVATTLEVLGILYAKQGKKTEAHDTTKKALAIYELDLGAKHPHVVRCCSKLAECCRAIGHSDEAKSLEDRVKAAQSDK